MSRQLVFFMMLSVWIAGCATTEHADVHSSSECDAHVLISPEQIQASWNTYGAAEITGTFIAAKRHFTYRFEISSKGNGGLEVGNLLLKVYDQHDNGDLFQPGLLCLCWVRDENGQIIGFELLGTLITSIDQNDNGIEPTERGISLRCVYDENQGRFVTAGDKEFIVLSE